MNATTLEAPATSAPAGTTTSGRSSRTAPVPPAPRHAPGRTRRRPGRGTGPEARPSRPLSTPVRARSAAQGPQACRVAPPAPQPELVVRRSAWRLTDRGIALVLVTGLLIVTAALAVVGLTALRVTGDHYQAAGRSVLATS